MGNGVFTPSWAPANPAGRSQRGTCFCVILTRNCGLVCCGENEMPTVISDRVVGYEGHVAMLNTEVSLSRAHCICTPRGFSVSCLPATSVWLVMLPKLQVINPNADDDLEDFQPPKKRSCNVDENFPSISQARKLRMQNGNVCR